MTNRELDAWLAEHAFGFVWMEIPPDAHGENAGRALVPGWMPESVRNNEFKLPNIGPVGPHYGVPAYSTDMVHSDALLDKMAELGWAWLLVRLPVDGEVRAEFWQPPATLRTCFSQRDRSKHRAIALAAKAALEAKCSATAP